MTGVAIKSKGGAAVAALVGLLTWPIRLIRGGIGLVVNPIVLKELKVSSRRKRTYLLRAGYLLLLVLSLLLTWWGVVQGSLTTSTAEVLQRQSQTGQSLSLTLGWIQLVALMLIAPMLTGSCVSDEIEDRSLDVLLITPLTAGQIIVGKLLSRLVYVGLLVLLSMPLLLAMRTYGGFTLEQLIKIEVLTLTTALLGASISILLSCWEARGWRAVAMTYFWLTLWWFAIPLIAVALFLVVVSVLKPLLPWVQWDLWMFDWEAYPFLMMHNNPLMVMGMLTIEAASGSAIPWPTQYAFLSVNAINLGLSAGVVLLAVPLLRRTANKRMAGAEQKALNWMVRLFRKRRTATPPSAPEPVAGNAIAPSGGVVNDAGSDQQAPLAVPRVWNNAVLWREMRVNLFRRPISAVFVTILVLGLLVWYNVEARVHREIDMLIPVVWIALIGQLVIACVVSPTVITSEKQARSWEVLLCVPMRPLTILWAKAIGSLKMSVIPLAVLVLELLYYSVRHPVLLMVAFQLALISIAFSMLLACTGAALSLRCKRSMTAMAANLGAAIALWGGLPAGIGILSELRGWSGRMEDALGVALLVNPFYWFAVMSEYLDSSSSHAAPAYDLQFWNARLSASEFTWLIAFVSAVVVAAGFGLLYACSTWFNRWVGRSS